MPGDDDLRCSSWARIAGVDPIGTAGSPAGFLLLEWPLPWPADLADVAELGPVVAACSATGVRLQGLVPEAGRPGGHRAAVLQRRPAGRFARYERVEVTAPPDRQVSAAVDLLAGGAPPAATAAPAVDVLVCGHGRRDRCCGTLGTALAVELAAGAAGLLGEHVSVRRTSHTGGHRFAATVLVLPQGTAWAFADVELVRRVVRQEGPLDDVLPRYRGCTALPGPAEQALERAAFAEVGWPWLSFRRDGWTEPGGRVVLEAEAPDGSLVAWEADAAEGRRLPVPVCGEPLESATKHEVEVRLTGVRRTR